MKLKEMAGYIGRPDSWYEPDDEPEEDESSDDTKEEELNDEIAKALGLSSITDRIGIIKFEKVSFKYTPMSPYTPTGVTELILKVEENQFIRANNGFKIDYDITYKDNEQNFQVDADQIAYVLRDIGVINKFYDTISDPKNAYNIEHLLINCGIPHFLLDNLHVELTDEADHDFLRIDGLQINSNISRKIVQTIIRKMFSEPDFVVDSNSAINKIWIDIKK